MTRALVSALGVSVVLSAACLTACTSDQPALGRADAGLGSSVTRASGGTGGAGGNAAGGGAQISRGGTGGNEDARVPDGRVSSGGAGANEDAGAPDSGGDGEAPLAYDCIGGEVARAKVDSGPDVDLLPGNPVIVPWTRSVGTCDVGTTYCYIQSLQYVRDALPVRTCDAVPAACSATPSCACLCSHGVAWGCYYTGCSCKDDMNGRATVACDQP